MAMTFLKMLWSVTRGNSFDPHLQKYFQKTALSQKNKLQVTVGELPKCQTHGKFLLIFGV
jgi:hypothetical protein